MPIHKVEGGWQWGHQKVYPTREGAERQQAAIYANGYKGDEAPDVDWDLLDEEFDELFKEDRRSTASDAKPFAAGVIYMVPSGKALWVKRAKGDLSGKWAFPGGHIEPGESLVETVKRESSEEISYVPEGNPVQFNEDKGYVTFIQPVAGEFQVVLNEEHSAWCWAPLDSPPEPVHPCIEKMLKERGMAKDAGQFDENKHKRGQPENAGQFGPGFSGGEHVHIHAAPQQHQEAKIPPKLGEAIKKEDQVYEQIHEGKFDISHIGGAKSVKEALDKVAPLRNAAKLSGDRDLIKLTTKLHDDLEYMSRFQDESRHGEEEGGETDEQYEKRLKHKSKIKEDFHKEYEGKGVKQSLEKLKPEENDLQVSEEQNQKMNEEHKIESETVWNGLTPDEKKSVERYTSNPDGKFGYRKINKAARKMDGVSDPKMTPEMKSTIDNLDKATKNHRIDSDKRLFRGVDNIGNIIGKQNLKKFMDNPRMLEGMEFTDKGFSSLSGDYSVSAQFSKGLGEGGFASEGFTDKSVVFAVNAKKGQSMLPLAGSNEIQMSDERVGESEYLLPRNSRVKVSKVSHNGDMWVLHADIAEDGMGNDSWAGIAEDAANWGEPVLAMDRSVRSFDMDGRLHVESTPISKANICEYYGREIPNYVSLGLDPDKRYKLYRDPEELRRGAKTFNNLPFLSKHVAVSAIEHHPELVIGSTGTDAEFDDPYLTNSLVVWVKSEIDKIKSEKKKQISSAYYYRADMTTGIAGSERYDGVMRDIVGNHVAHVEEGRAGPDVMVNDEDPIARSWRIIQEAFEVEYV